METINNNNYELWLLRYADGELTTAERAAVEAWLQDHPEAAEELALYAEAPQLERDESVEYPLSVAPQTKPLWPAVWRWSAAAAVVALLLLPAVRLLTPQEQPVEVAMITEEPMPTAQEQPLPQEQPMVRERNSAPVHAMRVKQTHPVVEELPIILEEEPVEQLLAEEFESLQEEAEESVPVTVEEPAIVEQKLVYVDNLFTVDSGDAIQQRLMAVNETLKGRLQGTYLGRRLARRMPTGDELLEYTDNLRERTPQGVRMMADMVLAYNDSNK